MSRLVYSVACSLDGYNSDASGGFDWAFPSEEVVSAINDDMADVSTFLYGRRMYETMSGWETEPEWADTPEMVRFAGIWQAAEKVVFSRTLDGVVTTRTRLERELTAESVERALAWCRSRTRAPDAPPVSRRAGAPPRRPRAPR